MKPHAKATQRSNIKKLTNMQEKKEKKLWLGTIIPKKVFILVGANWASCLTINLI
jgi:hypothetical protein